MIFHENKFAPGLLHLGPAGRAVKKAEEANNLIDISEYKPTHEKKETFTLLLNGSMLDINYDGDDPRYHAWADTTSIAVISINGETVPKKLAIKFPNPGASVMADKFPIWETEFCNKVTLYLSETTNTPVLILFPQNYVYLYSLNETQRISADYKDPKNVQYTFINRTGVIPVDDFSRLNSEMQQDFFNQVLANQRYIDRYTRILTSMK